MSCTCHPSDCSSLLLLADMNTHWGPHFAYLLLQHLHDHRQHSDWIQLSSKGDGTSFEIGICIKKLPFENVKAEALKKQLRSLQFNNVQSSKYGINGVFTGTLEGFRVQLLEKISQRNKKGNRYYDKSFSRYFIQPDHPMTSCDMTIFIRVTNIFYRQF